MKGCMLKGWKKGLVVLIRNLFVFVLNSYFEMKQELDFKFIHGKICLKK